MKKSGFGVVLIEQALSQEVQSIKIKQNHKNAEYMQKYWRKRLEFLHIYCMFAIF